MRSGVAAVPCTSPARGRCPGSLLWRDPKFLTLSAGMALGLFAQIGLIAHLFSLLVPALGAPVGRPRDGRRRPPRRSSGARWSAG